MKRTATVPCLLLLLLTLAGEEFYPHRHTGFFGKVTWGLCDARGKVVTRHICAGVTLASDGLAVGFRKNGEMFLLKNGAECGPFPFDPLISSSSIGDAFFLGKVFSEGLAAVKRNGKWGFADTRLKTVIPFKYDAAANFSCGLARVRKDGKWGYIDRSGRQVVDFQYEKAFDFKDGCASAVKEGRWGAVNTEGKEVLPFKYRYVGRFSHGLFPVSLNDRVYFFVDRKGKRVCRQEFSFALAFSRGVAVVSLKNGKTGAIDVRGDTVIPFVFDTLSDFSGKFYAYGETAEDRGLRFGFIDGTGKRLTPPVFTMADPVAEDIFLIARKYKIFKGTGTVFTPVDHTFVKIAPNGHLTYFED